MMKKLGLFLVCALLFLNGCERDKIYIDEGQIPITLSFSDENVMTNLGGGTFTEPTLKGHTRSDGEITYTATKPTVATVDSETGKVTIVGLGEVEITAKQAATEDFREGSASYKITVIDKTAVHLRFSSSAISVVNGSTVSEPTLTGHTVSGGAVAYTSNNTAVATVNATTGKITLQGIGTTTITATQAETATHMEGSASYALTVGGKIPVNLRFSSGAISVVNGSTVSEPTLTGHTVSGGVVAYTSNNTAVATVSLTTGKITLQGIGRTTIIATQAATATHMEGSASYTVEVTAPIGGCNGATTANIGGKIYNVVEVNGKCWMAEPLRLTSGFTNGKLIIRKVHTPYYYKRDAPLDYYVYYNWESAISLAHMKDKPTVNPSRQISKESVNIWGTKKIAGWHLPSNKEWEDAFPGNNLGAIEFDKKSHFTIRNILPGNIKFPLGGIHYGGIVWRNFFSMTGIHYAGYSWTYDNVSTGLFTTIKRVDRIHSDKIKTRAVTPTTEAHFVFLVKD